MKSGMIYSVHGRGKDAEIGLAVSVLKNTAKILRWIGVGCMVISGLGLMFIYLPLGIAEARYAWGRTMAGKEIARMERNRTIEQIQVGQWAGETPVKYDWTAPDNNYSIFIPKIGAMSRVISSVSTQDKNDYMAALQKGVAEAAGLSHPGENGTTFLFAHSVGNRIDYARYNAVFYLLDKLEVGDQIEIVYKNKLLKYQVWNREIMEPNNVTYLQPQYTEEKLLLQTCYPPGTTWKRLVVTARRI